MKKIELNTSEYTTKFQQATVYAKSAIVRAVQITQEGLESGAYADKDVRYEDGRFVIDTYVMREIPVAGTGDHVRSAALEDTRPVEIGEWIVTNPRAWDTDRDNNYAMPSATFEKRYEPTGEVGVYRARGMARIIPNDTGEAVEIEAPWGGVQNGDSKCYFCAPYNKDDPDDLAVDDRYILSENDFAAYAPADEVLGPDWDQAT